jgi:Rod binding domain-containing protein
MTELPPIDRTLLPADVRQAPREDQQRYVAALAFERQLIQQLTDRLADTAKALGSGDESDEGANAVTQAYAQMLPGALADAVTSAGGLGLARQLYDAMSEVRQ